MREAKPYQLQEAHTRFLYPFFFQRNEVKEAAGRLQKATLADATDSTDQRAVWQRAEAPGLYRDEVLQHVSEFLFAKHHAGPCDYLKVTGDALNSIFHGRALLQLPGGVTLPFKPTRRIGIELFLTKYGIGILSIALTPEKENLTLDEAIEFSYRLARFDPLPATELRIPQSSGDERLSQVAEDLNEPQRPGALGGTFTMPNLIAKLLAPLNEFGLEKMQQGLSAYAVVRFGADVDFDSAETRARLSPFLSKLAQVEESDHACAIEGSVGVADAVLNAQHWAACGSLGAAHFVADQTPPAGRDEHPFNEQRVPRVRDKYFVPYFMALLQRLFLNRTIREAGRIAASRKADAKERLAELREDILEFAVQGHFVQISSREALHRFYRIAQKGIDIPEAWQEINFAIANLDQRFATEYEHRVAQDMAQSLVSINRVQQAVHVIEYIVVGTYLAEVWHLFAADHLKDHGKVLSVTVLLAFVLGLVFVKIVNGYVERKHKKHGEA